MVEGRAANLTLIGQVDQAQIKTLAGDTRVDKPQRLELL